MPLNNSIRVYSKCFSKDDRGTFFLLATYTAIKYIYDGICLPVKQIPDLYDLIEKYYCKVSQQIIYPIEPDEQVPDNIGKYCLSMDKPQKRFSIFEINRPYCPPNPKVCFSLGHIINLLAIKKKAIVFTIM